MTSSKRTRAAGGRLDLKRLAQEHEHAIEILMRGYGCRTASEAVRLAILSAADAIEREDETPARVRTRIARAARRLRGERE